MEPPTTPARIDCRLTIVDWPLAGQDELEQMIVSLTTFEIANDPPALVEDATSRHLVWRGYLTGGLCALFGHLGEAISGRGLSAFYANQRLEVFVPSEGDVVALGALRHPLPLDRGEWDLRVKTAADDARLLHGLVWQRNSEAEAIIEAARSAEEAAEATSTVVMRMPEQLEVTPPGVVDWDWLEDAEFSLTQNYDPEGNEEDSALECQVLRFRTVVSPPWSDPPVEQGSEQSRGDLLLTWCVTQLEWGADDDGDEDWLVRVCTQVAPADFHQLLPEVLQEWVLGRARHAVESFGELAGEQPEEFEAHRRRADAELAALLHSPSE
jgi:hypothetical protein